MLEPHGVWSGSFSFKLPDMFSVAYLFVVAMYPIEVQYGHLDCP
jgi:hypothetical protein